MNLILGECKEEMSKMPENSVDSIVTDPPYGLSFMGKKWDYDVPAVDIWSECLRVLKPGGYLLAFAGTRTQHRMAVNIEDAGFEIRDMIAWIYGSGFPKSHNISKALDRKAGAERKVLETKKKLQSYGHKGNNCYGGDIDREGIQKITAPATEAAKKWDGFGTALKPALEPITVARKPLAEKTVAANVLKYGTGGLNIDGCRVNFESDADKAESVGKNQHEKYKNNGSAKDAMIPFLASEKRTNYQAPKGRWPANLIHDGSEEVKRLFPVTKGEKARKIKRTKQGSEIFKILGDEAGEMQPDNGGSAARYFYCAKASKKDRGAGNNHPTVKPTDLMRYLVRLVTPPGGIVLDPFMGSGSTMKAAKLEGFEGIGIEMTPEYFKIAEKRVQEAEKELNLFNK